MIQIEQLTKHYSQGKNVVRALDGVNLGIGNGEFVAVVGRSGSGKTTLLDGADTSRLKDGQKAGLRVEKIGFVFQEYNLLPTLSVIENVMLLLQYAARPKGDREWARNLLSEVGPADRMHHRPDQLSGGQQQRVAIARALVNRPSLVLGDEPTGAVDTETSDHLAELMRRVNSRYGVTFVIVTHDTDLATKTDRIIRLKDGRVVADETTAPEEEAV